MWVHNVLAVSNYLFVIPAIIQVHAIGELYYTLLIHTMILASMLMHISETKHGLLPHSTFVPFSNLFLNFDRAMAIVTALSFLPLVFIHPHPWSVIATFGIGGILSFIGEQTMVVAIYVPCHLVWHACAYFAMYECLKYY